MGAAKFLRGLVARIDPRRLSVIVNTGDDELFYGLHVSPDIDTVTYTLAGMSNPDTGWGLAGESFNALGALERFYGKGWFALGDRDLATHLYRTDRLRQGWPLSQITAEIARRCKVKVRIMPMTDDRVRTFVKLHGRAAMPFPGILRTQSCPRTSRKNRTARDRTGASPAPGTRRNPIIGGGGPGAVQSVCLAGSDPGA